MEIPNSTDEHEARISRLQHARLAANKKLLDRAIYANKIRDSCLDSNKPIQVGKWVLVRHEDKQKFEAKWYGPYKILSYHPLGTYRLASPKGAVLKNLFNGNRLIEANVVNDDVKEWSSSKRQAELRRENKKPIPATSEVQEILDADEPLPPTYDELTIMTRKEWLRVENEEREKAKERSGERSGKVGEETDTMDLTEDAGQPDSSSNITQEPDVTQRPQSLLTPKAKERVSHRPRKMRSDKGKTRKPYRNKNPSSETPPAEKIVSNLESPIALADAGSMDLDTASEDVSILSVTASMDQPATMDSEGGLDLVRPSHDASSSSHQRKLSRNRKERKSQQPNSHAQRWLPIQGSSFLSEVRIPLPRI